MDFHKRRIIFYWLYIGEVIPQTLEEIAKSNRAELVLVYRTRKVGKSTLLIEFAWNWKISKVMIAFK